jgi:hypothetical protein
MTMDTYTIPITPLKGFCAFDDIENGEAFTLPGVTGFGNIFTGFPVYIKTGEASAIDFISGETKGFEPHREVVKLRIGLLKKEAV